MKVAVGRDQVDPVELLQKARNWKCLQEAGAFEPASDMDDNNVIVHRFQPVVTAPRAEGLQPLAAAV